MRRYVWYVAGLVLVFVVGIMVGDAIGTYHCVSPTTTGQGSVHLLQQLAKQAGEE
jgi:hypothetical protein